MTSSPAKMLVSIGDKFACVRINGRANFTTSVDFKTLLNELLQSFNLIILDLTDCVLMDSTFLGVLAGFGLKVAVPQTGGKQGMIELFNPNPRITELLENLGVLHLFKTCQGEVKLPDKAGADTPAPDTGASREEVTRTCLEAHQTLMQLNPENATRFKDVAAFLAEDLKKLKAKS